MNNGNGRDARATAATIDAPVPLKICTWWKQMVDSKLALNTGGATGNIDHMLALGTGDAAMTIEASGVIGTVKQVLESGQYSTVKIGIAPLPAFEPATAACPSVTGRSGSRKASPLASARRRGSS